MPHQIGTAHLPIRMLSKAHPQIDVASTATVRSLAAFAGHPNGLAGLNAFRNSHLVSFCFFPTSARVGAPHRNGAHGTFEHLIERDENVALDVLATRRLRFLVAVGKFLRVETRTSARSASASTKKLFKEITEARALELEFVFSATRCTSG